ncbi:MAG TPA: hypothetical protein VNF27_12250 [Candidatus Binataceae bacterium]|nr:hypothetical protein [Candidatus Binataceae bacterium]
MNFRIAPTAAVIGLIAVLTIGAGSHALRSVSAAQQTTPTATNPPAIVTGHPAALASRGSIRYSDLPPLAPRARRAIRSIPRRVPDFAQYLQALAALEAAPGTGAATLATVQASIAEAVGANFAGIDEPNSDCQCEPPDTQVAAGPSDVVEVVNVAMNVFDKSGNFLGAKSLNDLFGIGSNFSTDPRIRYDTQSGRWFISMLSLDNAKINLSHNSYFNLAISKSSDPTGTWTLYQYETPGSLGDQPGLGISNDKVAITGNAFSCSPSCNSNQFLGNEVLVIDKSDLVSGATSPRADFYPPPVDNNSFTILPAHEIAATGLALPDTLYMASVQYPTASSIVVFEVTGTPSGGKSHGTLISPTSRPIGALDIPPPAPQLGTSKQLIDSGDNRLQDAEWRDGALWVAGDSQCIPAGDSSARACMRYIEILTSSMTVNQDFDFGTSNFYYYYPSIALDQSDNLITAFSGSSSTTHPSAYVSSQLSTDPPNSLRAPAILAPGVAIYDGTRWGDYSGAGIDPSDQSTAWVAAEFSAPGSSANWGTEIAAVQAPIGASPSPTPTPTPGKLALSKHKFNFDRVKIGKVAVQNAKVRNIAPGTLIVTIQSGLAPPFSSPQSGQTLTLGYRQSATIAIQFAPVATGEQSETLRLTSNDPRNPSVAIAVRGNGRAP